MLKMILFSILILLHATERVPFSSFILSLYNAWKRGRPRNSLYKESTLTWSSCIYLLCLKSLQSVPYLAKINLFVKHKQTEKLYFFLLKISKASLLKLKNPQEISIHSRNGKFRSFFQL